MRMSFNMAWRLRADSVHSYAGWIGTIAARYYEGHGTELSPHPSIQESTRRLAAVAGTSTCHIAQSQEGVFVPGVWGPYKVSVGLSPQHLHLILVISKNAVFPGWWMNEGGQSATGQVTCSIHLLILFLTEVAAH